MKKSLQTLLIVCLLVAFAAISVTVSMAISADTAVAASAPATTNSQAAENAVTLAANSQAAENAVTLAANSQAAENTAAVADSTAAKSEARAALETTLNEALAILSQPEFKDPAQNAPLMQAIKDKVYGICDFQEFSARTIGGHWRSFTPEQQQNFMDAFGELLFETYNSKLLAYDGQQIEFLGETTSSKGDKVEIRTAIPYQDQKALVNYRMLKKDSGWKVYDLIIENIGMVQNYRNQFQDILNKQTPEELIASIKAKANETREKNSVVQN